ncbi:PAS domain-containing sensor histidine kinase [Pontibacter rugosus]
MEQNQLPTQFSNAILLHSPYFTCLIDQSGLIKQVSESAKRHVGYQEDELIGKDVLEFIYPGDKRLVLTTMHKLSSEPGAATSYTIRYRSKNGDWRWLEAHVSNQTKDELLKSYVVYARDVTQQQETALANKVDLHYYNSLFQNHPGIVFSLTPEGIFDRINASVQKVLLYHEEEMIGEHFSKFTAPSFTFEAIKALSKASNQEPSVIEGKVINKHGKAVTLIITLIPVYLCPTKIGILGTARDISAEKTAQRELEKLSLVASKAVSCVVITDALGRTEWVNSEFTRVTGYTLREVLGKKPGHLLQGPDTDPMAVQYMNSQVLKKQPFHVELINYRKNGEKFWFSMNITPMFDDEGNLVQFFAIQDDVTERKQSEKKMLLAEDLQKHNQELQQFNYIVSHNLRTPVANLLGLASILEQHPHDSENFHSSLQKLKQTAMSLFNVIKDLNDLLSLRDFDTNPNREQVCIHSVCQEVLKSLEDRFESLRASVNLAIPEDACLQATRAYIYSIFHNLIANAIKYRDTERPLEVSIRHEATEQYLIFKVEDNGVGIDLDKAKNSIFKLYGKIDKRADGRGMGLYMVKAQIESIGGSIEVESTPGKGTTFILSFPKKQ